jgi:GNAT superfamily N-acetyltransferase
VPIELQNFLLGRLSSLEPCLAFDQVITYHGTRTSALQSIRDNGILSHPFKHYHPSRFYKADRGASVYLTENPNIAAQWALSEVNDPSLATILQVVVPKEGLRPDEEAPEAERFVGDIPPEWIQATYSLNPDGSLGQAVPFHADPRLSQSVEDATKTKRFMVIQHSSPSAQDAGKFEENKHPRDEGGKFAASNSTNRLDLKTQHVGGGKTGRVLYSGKLKPEHKSWLDVTDDPVAEATVDLNHENKTAYLNRIDAFHRGKGYGPELLNTILSDLKNNNFYHTRTYIEHPNVASQTIFRKAGFTPVEEKEHGSYWERKGAQDISMDSKLEPLRQWMLERFVERAPVMAMDRSPFSPLKSESSSIAMDRGPTARRQNEDGDLHVAISNISKATVNPYWGHEIPNWRELKLEPDKKYMLLRDPKELEKAAHTFNNLPILAEHKPRTADKHPAHLVVGSTGTDAQYAHPYLKNSLVFWTKPAIDAIEEDEQKELSCAYHYDPDMTPGVYEGQRYDGVMRNIRGNHVAQVRDGRAGADVVVQDAAFEEGKHPRGEGGQFTTVTKGSHSSGEKHLLSRHPDKYAPAQHFEVHHKGKHLGHVRTYVSSSELKPGGKSKPAPARIKWEANPVQEQGTEYRRSASQLPSKKEAVEYLVRHFGAKDTAQDSSISRRSDMPKITPAALVARSALFTYLTPRLAQDAKFDYDAVVKDVTSKNFKDHSKTILDAVTASTKDKLAKDADISDLANLLDALSPQAEQADAMTLDPNSAVPLKKTAGEDDVDPEDTVSKIKAYLEEQGVSPEILANLDAFLAEPANPDPDTPTPGEDEELDEEGKPKNKAEDAVIPEQQKGLVTTGAMDAAIKKAVSQATKDATDRTLKTQREIRTAERFVRPWVGDMAMDAACPADVYRTTLKALGMDAKKVDDMHADALLPVLEAQAKPSRQHQQSGGSKIAQDGKPPEQTFHERFPFMKDVTVQ